MKKIIQVFLLLVFGAVFGFFGWQFAGAKGEAALPLPTATNQLRSPTPTEAGQTCAVTTGIHNGTVNLRACPGAACGKVLDILTEGATLRVAIIMAGEYVNVTTTRGVTGWLNSKYCEVK